MNKNFQGYKVVANFADKVVLAVNKMAVEPYVVWYLDRAGDPYWGTYTTNYNLARHEFCKRVINGVAIKDCVIDDC